MQKNNYILYYNGPIDNEVLTQHRFQELNIDAISPKLEKKLFMILVELGQNIGKYSLSKAEKTACGIGELSIVKEGSYFVFRAKNLAKREAAIQVIHRFEQLNTLDRKTLRDLRRDIMSMPYDPTQIGAKLGLIQVCLYSDKPVEATFDSPNENHGTLSITAQIKQVE